MTPATKWRDELCNKYILNSREGGWLVEFIERIQKDAMVTPMIVYEQPQAD